MKPGFRIIVGLENAAISASNSGAHDRREQSWRGARPKVKTFLIGKAKQHRLETLATEAGTKSNQKGVPAVGSLRSPSPGSSFDENMLVGVSVSG
jgi:hypothetical protein